MKKTLLFAAACVVATLSQATPIPAGHWELGRTLKAYVDAGTTPNSMFNPRYFDGYAYANQINVQCFARYASGSNTADVAVNNSANPSFESRMIGSFRGAYSSTYMMGSSSVAVGATTSTFARWNWDGSNPIQTASPDDVVVESYDWVNDHTIIFTCSKSPNTKRLYLADVVADPFSVTKNTAWNTNGYVETAVSGRVRNARVGNVYGGYAYYSDAQTNNPTFWAINLANGASTLLGTLGVLSNSSSYGIWNVVERGGYLYVHTSGDGIQVYNMINATTLGALNTTYTKAELDALTGIASTAQYYGLDVLPDGSRLLLGAAFGDVYELQGRLPILSGNWQLGRTLAPAIYMGGITVNSMFNPRYFGGYVYANQINDPCFGRYAAGSVLPEATVNNTADHTYEHRMVLGFPGVYSSTYMLGSSSGNSVNGTSYTTTTFTRYDWDGSNPVRIDAVDSQRVDTFDWVDDDTIITTDGTTGNRARLYLVDVTAEPFAMTPNTNWNADGYVTTTTTSVRNARVGQMYRGYAYYGDYVASSPKFYAINLATGVSTELGSLGVLSTGGIWTAVERGGYLFLQTPSDGIYVYNMTDATTLGSLYTTYTKAELDVCTGYASDTQIYGLDVSPDLSTFIIGVAWANVFEMAPAFRLGISQSSIGAVLSWPAYYAGAVIESSPDLSLGFNDMSPQPSVAKGGILNTAIIPPSGARFFRLRR